MVVVAVVAAPAKNGFSGSGRGVVGQPVDVVVSLVSSAFTWVFVIGCGCVVN